MCKETDTFSSTGLTFYRNTDNTQENTFVEALSTLRDRSLGRLHEGGGRSIRVLPGTRISVCRYPEAGMGLDGGGLEKRKGQMERGEAGRYETRARLGGQSRTVIRWVPQGG